MASYAQAAVVIRYFHRQTHPLGHVYRWTVPLPDGSLPRVDPIETGMWECNRESLEDLRDKLIGEVEERINGSQKSLTNLPTSSSSLECSLNSLNSLLRDRVAKAIERTIPTSGGKRHRKTFDFVRELRAIPELADLRPQALRPIVQEWHRRALPFIKTQAFEETWFDFVEGWAKVKFPKGQGPIDRAFQMAVAAEVPEVALQYDQPKLRLLVSLCRELQRANPHGPIFLSAREGGRLLDVSHVQASRWMKLLCLDNILTLESQGDIESGKASRYYYIAES